MIADALVAGTKLMKSQFVTFAAHPLAQQTMIRLKDVFDVSFAFHEVSIGLETCFMRVLRVSLSPFLKRVSLKPNGNVSERFQ